MTRPRTVAIRTTGTLFVFPTGGWHPAPANNTTPSRVFREAFIDGEYCPSCVCRSTGKECKRLSQAKPEYCSLISRGFKEDLLERKNVAGQFLLTGWELIE